MPQPGEGPNLEQFSPLAEIIGFPPALLARSTMARHVALAVTSTFSDGEVGFSHKSFRREDITMREQFGEERYAEGAFGSHLRDLVEGPDPVRAKAARLFVALGAKLFAERVVAGAPPLLNTRPSVRVNRGDRKLLFDDHEYPLQLDPRLVVDYGPGMAGRFHADQQITDLTLAGSTYQYLGLAKGEFVPTFLSHYLELRGARHPHQVDTIKEGHLYTVFKRGIEESTQRLIAPPPASEAQTEAEGVADVVIASGIHSAGEAALHGVALAFPLLRKKGVLLIRGPKTPPEEDPGVSMAEMLQAGLDAGFRARGMRAFDSTTVNPAHSQYAQQAIIMQKL